MQTLEIYGKRLTDPDGGTRDCIFCARAKALLEKRGLPFEYHDITDDPELQAEFTTRTNGAQTVPQVFAGHHRIGGFTDLAAADRSGLLQQLIAGE